MGSGRVRELEERIAADEAAIALLLEIGDLCVRAGSRTEDCLTGIMDAAIALTGADKGNLQLFADEAGALVIAAQRGFDEPFLRFFARVSLHESAACAAALTSGRRIMVEDVTTSDIFAGQPSLEVMLQAGARAVQSTPLISSEGATLGMISTHFNRPHRFTDRELRFADLLARQAADYLERKKSEDALRALTTELRQTTQALATGLTHCSRDLRYVTANPAYAELAGVPIERIVGRPIVEVMGEEAFQANLPYIERALQGERAEYETELPWQSPGRRWAHIVYAPYQEQDDTISGWVASVTDINARKQAELRQKLLVAELNHRVKNTLATVQSIAHHTLTDAADIDRREAFEARLIALARTHDTLTRSGWEGVPLRELVSRALGAFRAAGERDIGFSLDGPDLQIQPKAALALAMAFHEMATNASKYGAWSIRSGQISVSWDLTDQPQPHMLRLRWAETGGPPVRRPDRQGFGLTLIERDLSRELEGQVAIAFDPAGLVCTIDIPLPDGRRQ